MIPMSVYLSWIPAILTCIGGIIWAVRLEGRVNTHDSIFIEREKQADSRDRDLQKRLDRVEVKIDTLLDRVKRDS